MVMYFIYFHIMFAFTYIMFSILSRSPSIIHPQPSTSGCLHPNGNQTQLSISSSGDEGDFINAEDVVPHPSYSEKDVTGKYKSFFVINLLFINFIILLQ